RSQSCTDTVTDAPPPMWRRAAQSQQTRVPGNNGSLAGVAGVLLSTENSRSFSAPVLTSERRLAISSLNSFTPLHKPERSISPESNDSISEELNHFKPIVCSPCTPPKKLPDGRVLSPVIIKSTPRNLRRNLQKPTSYEASPMVLKKWEQVFQDRQMKRTLSKGTLTTSVEEDGPSLRKPETASKGAAACQITFSDVGPAGDVELPPHCSREDVSRANCDSKEQSSPCGNCFRNAEPATRRGFADAAVNVQVGTKSRLATRLTSSRKTISTCKCLVAKPMKSSLKRAHKKTSQSIGVQNGSCFSTTEAISLAFPPRRGQKRRCKTKHLEQNGGLKRLRVACRSGQGGLERIWRKKLNQEEEDKKLALKLQQIFDKESRRVKRCKGSRDEYPLRSKSTAGAN
ncbi:PREDICTED: E3 ubiquitin-protein ligase RNF169, partial [Nanorana parkeri]|uniref:E3 ubiquitin-protein ligase RNF169 n=1 Tax=Nanorana parkeri TaxID=125878 RepID=UPI000854586A